MPDAPTPLTEAEFAARCARLSANAAHWAADTLTGGHPLDTPIARDAARRYLAEMRERLDWLEEDAGLAPATPPRPSRIRSALRWLLRGQPGDIGMWP
jgi:hypothetical protein